MGVHSGNRRGRISRLNSHALVIGSFHVRAPEIRINASALFWSPFRSAIKPSKVKARAFSGFERRARCAHSRAESRLPSGLINCCCTSLQEHVGPRVDHHADPGIGGRLHDRGDLVGLQRHRLELGRSRDDVFEIDADGSGGDDAKDHVGDGIGDAA